MVGLVGISHQTALVNVREKLVIDEGDISGLYQFLNQQCGVDGIFALSTCNRTEIYFEIEEATISETEMMEKMKDAFIRYFSTSLDIRQYLYSFAGADAARHLCRVATGLDSLILGEYQIVSQIKSAFSVVENTAIIGPVLTRMVQKAFEAGKLVRTHTSINRGAVSVSSAAVELAGKMKGCLSKLTALSVGAGETGSIVALNLSKKGCKNIRITNRTHQKALKLAERVNGEAIEFSSYLEQLNTVDVAIFSTGSPTPLLSAGHMQQVMTNRNGKSLLVIDLCVPRNVEADVAQIDGVTLLDLDHLEEVVKLNFEKRKGELSSAETIIEEVVSEFEDWMYVRQLSGTISTITGLFKKVHEEEARNYKKCKSDEEAFQRINDYGDHLSAKFTRMLIRQLREVTNEGRDPEKVKVVSELFKFTNRN
jgi:glutamyl-tRNA reductase